MSDATEIDPGIRQGAAISRPTEATVPPKAPEELLIRLYSRDATPESMSRPASFSAVQSAANRVMKAVWETLPHVLADERREERAWVRSQFDSAARHIAKLIGEDARQQAELAELRAQIGELRALLGEHKAETRLQPAGQRGPRGPRGEPAPVITRWSIDEERFVATPIMSDQSHGAALELRGLLTSVARALAEAQS